MKKVLLTLAAFSLYAMAANAQTRLVLYEEFTGESCGPCAATNPGLETLMDANAGKVQMIKFMSYIPATGPFYFQNKPMSDARHSYYGVPFAPYGRMDGTVMNAGTSSPGHPGYLTQSDINTMTAKTSPFNITVAAAWSANYDSVIATVTVSAVSAYAPTGATGSSIKMRAALIEDVNWGTAPGTNGEKHFPGVVRTMYPDVNGTSVDSAWALGTTQTYTISGKVPSYVDKNGSPKLVVWIQNDLDKSVAQTAVSPVLAAPSLTTDAGIDTIYQGFACSSPGSVIAVLHNHGTTTLTSASIYTGKFNLSLGHTVWSTTPTAWTGTLAPGATTTVAINTTLTAGKNQIFDSVAVAGETNTGNDVAIGNINYMKTGNPLPISSNFDVSPYLPSTWLTPTNDQGDSWSPVWSGSTSQNIGHNNSPFMLWWTNPNFADGEVGYVILPTPKITGPSVITFYEAYAQQDASNNDELAVVYSADCGGTWNTLWSKSGADLASAPATTSQFVPADDSQWLGFAVDITSIPTDAMIAFRATSHGGNLLFLDDVAMHTGFVGVKNVIANASNINIFPNPARDNAVLNITLSETTNLHVTVIDELGRTVATVVNKNMNAGTQKIDINTTNLASGVYNVKIETTQGTTTERLSVVK